MSGGTLPQSLLETLVDYAPSTSRASLDGFRRWLHLRAVGLVQTKCASHHSLSTDALLIKSTHLGASCRVSCTRQTGMRARLVRTSPAGSRTRACSVSAVLGSGGLYLTVD